MHTKLLVFMLLCLLCTITFTKSIGPPMRYNAIRVCPRCPPPIYSPVTEPAPTFDRRFQEPLKSNNNKNGARKKSMFLSRGWGAGGMPFSVLYMDPTHAAYPKAAPVQSVQYRGMDKAQIKPPVLSSKKQAVLQPQARTALRSKPIKGKVHQPAIPHLFVSYGWGPVGRK